MNIINKSNQVIKDYLLPVSVACASAAVSGLTMGVAVPHSVYMGLR